MTENDEKAFFGMLSLCMRAGRLALGYGRAETAVKNGEASLIIVSADASENTKKKFSDMAAYRGLPIIFVSDRERIGRSVGREFTVICAVTDRGFADRLREIYKEIQNGIDGSEQKG